jgi:poly(A) polymerase
MSGALDAAREALAGKRAWLVGGAVRDELLGRKSADVDIVVAGEPAPAAKAIASAAGRAACFALSEEFGSWRVVARGGGWQLDVEPLRGATIEEDLRLRDFTVNAIAQELTAQAPIDPLGGIADLKARRLRMAVELDFQVERPTAEAACVHARGLAGVSSERVFMELRRIVAAEHARRGIEMLDQIGATAVVLPELSSMRGVQQSRFHHLDVYGHTLEVLDRTIELTNSARRALTAELEQALGARRLEVEALLAEPLADSMTRAEALRWGALLHDAAKPATHDVRPEDGRVTFIGHDRLGADLARAILTRLRASERLRAHVAALVRHHLRLGFLVHEPQPLARRTVFAYLRACQPVQVDVTLLSLADRLATRGDSAQEAIQAHMRVARELLGDALEWHAHGPPQPLLGGDELARAVGIDSGPRVGEMLERLAAAQYAGEIVTRADALACAHTLAKTI